MENEAGVEEEAAHDNLGWGEMMGYANGEGAGICPCSLFVVNMDNGGLFRGVLRCDAAREEGVAHDLRCLASGGISSRSEVGQVPHPARFAWASALVAADHGTIS